MKKKLGILLIILSFFTVDATINYAKKKDKQIVYKEDEEIKAIYISYLEFYNNFYGGSKSVNQSKIEKMIDNIKNNNFNAIFLHVSPFSDSIYNSKIFPYSIALTGKEGKNPGFDYLEYFIKIAHSRNIKIHAWINPYRISFESDVNKISQDNPAYQLIGTSNILADKKGIYYNPASEIVKNLILRQIEEIINNYNVDGIHFDDYFYMQKDIDKLEYSNYQKNGGKMNLSEFRLHNTNDLIERVYKTIKEKDNNIVFSIAPDGNINNNYQYHYADVKMWLKSDKYVDMIMPQIYYGFNNEYSPFINVLENWNKITTNKDIKIVPVLALYKCGEVDNEAGKGKNEWMNNSDVLMRQVAIIRNQSLKGFALFRYDYMYKYEKMNDICVKEIENLRKIN